MAAVLHAVAVPPTGGDTLFADMHAAYEGLDDDTKARIDGLTAGHDHVPSFGHQVRPERRDEFRAKFPPVEHPVVRTHPETGRKLIYVNRFFTSHVVGMEPAESRALIEELSRQADIIEYPVPHPVDSRLGGHVGQPCGAALRVQRLLAV